METNTNTQNTQQNDTTKCFYPMLVSSGKGVVDSGEAVVSRWEKFKTLSEKSREILLSEETPRAIKNISHKLQLAPQQTEGISRLVRDVFFGNIERKDIVGELAQKVGFNEQQARAIAQEIKNKIFLLSPQKHSSPKQSITTENLPILQALKKYPGVSEQLITANHIGVGSASEPVKPSVRNWIIDYRYVKGNDVYEDLERGNYLFHGKNTVKLTLPERQRLSMVLKSLDNNTLLPIDARRQQIIFSQTKIGAGQKIATTEKQPVKNDWNKIRDNWQKTTSERERKGRQSISKSKGMPREPQSQASTKSPLGSVRDFNFSSPQKFESEKNLDDLKRATNAGVKPPPKTASNDLDNIHSALTEQAKKIEKKEKIKSHKYQIYPIGDSAASRKVEPKIKGNVIDLKGDSRP